MSKMKKHLFRELPLLAAPPAVNDFDPNPMASARWKNRRKIAYIALGSMLIVTALLFSPLVPLDRIAAIAGAIEWFYLSMSGIVGSYMGLSTWASMHTSSRLAASYGTDGSQPTVTT